MLLLCLQELFAGLRASLVQAQGAFWHALFEPSQHSFFAKACGGMQAGNKGELFPKVQKPVFKKLF